MHDTTQIQQTKQKADHLLLLSLTPLGLIGIPRLLAGKDMHSWKFTAVLYIVSIVTVMNAGPLEATNPNSSGLLNASGVFLYTWAVTLHAFMVVKDATMFWRISKDKQSFLDSRLGMQQLTLTNR